MTDEQRMEQFSLAYVRAVAAAAGVNVYRPEVDDDSVDIGFCARLSRQRVMRPRLDAQVKCTAVPDETDTAFRFPLKLKNYNDLRDDSVPRILILVVVPPDPGEWLRQSPEEMVLRKAAYFHSLAGQPETENTASVTVAVPKANLFDVTALRALLEPRVTP